MSKNEYESVYEILKTMRKIESRKKIPVGMTIFRGDPKYDKGNITGLKSLCNYSPMLFEIWEKHSPRGLNVDSFFTDENYRTKVLKFYTYYVTFQWEYRDDWSWEYFHDRTFIPQYTEYMATCRTITVRHEGGKIERQFKPSELDTNWEMLNFDVEQSKSYISQCVKSRMLFAADNGVYWQVHEKDEDGYTSEDSEDSEDIKTMDRTHVKLVKYFKHMLNEIPLKLTLQFDKKYPNTKYTIT